ncbi:hypothetical protein TRFO_11750 [Tritrichomonas foetus]|uniref:E2F/DP family winged-helix DNA-binding domain-containing protein n=1 Tax=Tritrichomonas foetus TaxID=1144522 RepID=A0A1J4J222_9EUKA|nr:hypothetical protein TRFO_11750 [Tritrichomonas foetus]|eukprot:OHS93534.1 hypothetical protein TRFO_11750 [Tritrichomonas foetus]
MFLTATPSLSYEFFDDSTIQSESSTKMSLKQGHSIIHKETPNGIPQIRAFADPQSQMNRSDRENATNNPYSSPNDTFLNLDASGLSDDAEIIETKHGKQMKPSKRINKRVFNMIFKKLIVAFEENPSLEVRMMDVSRHYGVQHRRIYDFFNLLTHFGVCVNKGHGKIGWIGLANIQYYFEKVYRKLEKKSNTMNALDIFYAGQSPSLGLITKKIISLYMYAGVDILNIKFIAKMISQGHGEIKSLERRIYLVLNMLEIVNVVSHTTKVSEYKLLFNYKKHDQEVFQERLNEMSSVDECYPMNFLNRFDEKMIEKIRETRLQAMIKFVNSINEKYMA